MVQRKLSAKLLLNKRFKSFSEKKSDLLTMRSSRSQIFFKIDVLKNFAIFNGKQHKCFPVNMAKFLRPAFLLHSRKVEPSTLRQDTRPGLQCGTLTWDPKVGPYGGTLKWDPHVEPWGGTLMWEAKVRARRTGFINENKLVKLHLCKSDKPQFK